MSHYKKKCPTIAGPSISTKFNTGSSNGTYLSLIRNNPGCQSFCCKVIDHFESLINKHVNKCQQLSRDDQLAFYLRLIKLDSGGESWTLRKLSTQDNCLLRLKGVRITNQTAWSVFMGKSYAKSKGRGEGGAFFKFPKSVLNCQNYLKLSHHARSLLLDFVQQYNGKNNGDLVAHFSYLKERGWRSKSTIKSRLDELIYYGFIVCVQQGGINCGSKQRPNLYALTWLQIDKVGYSDGYYQDSEWKVNQIAGTWKIEKPAMRQERPKRKPPTRKIEGRLPNLAVPTHVPRSG